MTIRNTIAAFLFLLPVTLHAQTVKEALNKKDTTAAIALIKEGVNVNELDSFGSSLLMYFCRWGDEDNVRFLLAHGTTADAPRSPKGRTPLMVACAYYAGKTICRMLIDKGADINATAQDGTTPLMLAAQNAKLDVVELLLKKGANANAKDATGKTALDIINSAKIDDFIVKSVKDCRIDKPGVIALLEAATKK
jgi:ankyrin repeat protein